MPFPGPNVSHRTPRKIALEKSDSRHFVEGDANYSPTAGVPESSEYAGQDKPYADEAMAANASEANSQPHEHQKSPFKGI